MKYVHIVTLEDEVEFLHPYLKATFSQRELGRDFYHYPDGLPRRCCLPLRKTDTNNPGEFMRSAKAARF
jgi:hypothetical protein